ncbi:MAG: penicillin-binding protein 2 [Thermaerobacter sp.]|nr:penicillin-binding protein 2 [Thermaerobacter sp.]
MKGRPRPLVRMRAVWSLIGASLLMIVIMVRLVMIQVGNASFLQAYALGIHQRSVTLPAARGEILDRNGTVLAMDVPRYQVVAAPRYITHPGHEATVLARYLPFSQHALWSVLSTKNWWANVATSVSAATANQITSQNLTGISVVPITGREYPNGTLASQVIGMVGSSGQGLAGIELAQNRVLAGKPGSWQVGVDGFGNPMPQWQTAYKPPVPGNNIQLTIDANIEAVAQKWLKWGVQRAHAKNGTVIIMDTHTGAIVALANWPNFNPNNYYNATALQMTNYAIQDPVPPGSIFKPVTVSAALALGLYTPNSLFDTRGYKIVSGVRINDWKPGGWGWITLTRGLEVSSDQVFMDLALKLGAAALYRYVHAFGLNQPSGVGLPGDSNSLWLPVSQVNQVDLATMGFGQGFAVTPMQMITADNAVANNGTLVKPQLIRAVLSPSGKVISRTHPIVEGHPITPQIAAEIQHMMTLEATQGTGVPAQVPGYIIAGKTGTSQKVINGRTSNSKFIASYLGYAPMPNPTFTMLVMINHPVGSLFYGDQVSAPVWQKIATFLFHYWKIKPYASADNGSAPGPVVP